MEYNLRNKRNKQLNVNAIRLYRLNPGVLKELKTNINRLDLASKLILFDMCTFIYNIINR